MLPLTDPTIVRAAIHPAIGIARIGDSFEQWFPAPETCEPAAEPPGGYRDPQGALKRQAAVFRIYGYDADGNVVKELTADDGKITWTAHVANRKAAWYDFRTALDIEGAKPTPRRNADITGTKRQLLVIDPGARAISGRDAYGVGFDTGEFMDETVALGQMRTDAWGRLIFLGGRGKSGSYDGKPPTTFADNDGWYDDTSDGPVDATITLHDGTQLQAEGAWVVVAPPNYAPDIVGFQTMFDVIEDVFVTPSDITEVSFTRDVWPVLRQLTDLQWVNYGFAVGFGWDAPYDFTRPEIFEKLHHKVDAYTEFRRQIFNMFRVPGSTQVSKQAWPAFYGDNMDVDLTNPDSLMAVTPTIYRRLELWAQGAFVDDWDTAPRYAALDQVPLQEQPAMLDKAALWFCLGGPFHPGCEMTWPMRLSTMYTAPFRIRRRAPDAPQPDYGEYLMPLAPGATPPPGTPYHEQGPGDVTQWMAVPWQTDTASCRSGYDSGYDKYLPTFWPARVPNWVISEAAYAIVMDVRRPMEDRLAAFNDRMDWDDTLPGTSYGAQVTAMVKLFPKMGLVTRRPGPSDGAFPDPLYVSDGKPAAPTLASMAESAVGAIRHAVGAAQDEGAARINPRLLAHANRATPRREG